MTLTRSTYESRWKSIAHSRLWLMLFVAIGSVSSAIYPHPPLVALGAIAGTTLSPRRALLAAIALWFASQLYGFGLRGYPQTVEAIAWGLAIGLGTLLVTAIASLRPASSRTDFRRHCLWIGASAIAGFAVFQGIIFSLGWLLTGTHILTGAIVTQLFAKELLWTGILTVAYRLLFKRDR
ncbi:MAG: hypothetical protein HC895_02345 [Leptolyngbyaceae cyanobacterium SM1_3_5]|nr:hypothetical protein [Leptolyngbyaceae cyanobacterium SM1_3_5]